MNVRRLARVMTYAGIVGVVVGLSVIHASVIADPPYTFTDSFRFAWAMTEAWMTLSPTTTPTIPA